MQTVDSDVACYLPTSIFQFLDIIWVCFKPRGVTAVDTEGDKSFPSIIINVNISQKVTSVGWFVSTMLTNVKMSEILLIVLSSCFEPQKQIGIKLRHTRLFFDSA